MLTIKNLSYGYPKGPLVLHDVSFSLEPGITLLVGENGSGKSTLIKLLVSALPSKTPIFVDGAELSSITLKQQMAYLPQEFDIYPSLKVSEILRFVARAKGVRDDVFSAQIQEISMQVSIEEVLDKKFKVCSIGTRRRVGIATTLIGNPRIIILDEPTAGIDPKERIRFYHLIKQCFAGKTVLLATHILDDMDVLADNVLMLSHGTLTYHDSYSNFRHSLDDRVYEISAEPLTRSESEFIGRSILLSRYDKEEATVYRIAAPEKLSPPSDRFVPSAPTLEDIWTYHQEINSYA